MAIDLKYGRIVLADHPDHIPDDEPVIVFRAQDALLPDMLRHYEQRCRQEGSPERHLDRTRQSLHEISGWQADHPNSVKTPGSERSRAWLDADGEGSMTGR